jgi:hypothetical protein
MADSDVDTVRRAFDAWDTAGDPGHAAEAVDA